MTKQGQTTFFLAGLVLLAGAPADAASRGKAAFAPSPPPPPSTVGTGRAGAHNVRTDPRYAPPMAPDRKVTEQDCSKPVDLTRGNLKCK